MNLKKNMPLFIFFCKRIYPLPPKTKKWQGLLVPLSLPLIFTQKIIQSGSQHLQTLEVLELVQKYIQECQTDLHPHFTYLSNFCFGNSYYIKIWFLHSSSSGTRRSSILRYKQSLCFCRSSFTSRKMSCTCTSSVREDFPEPVLLSLAILKDSFHPSPIRGPLLTFNLRIINSHLSQPRFHEFKGATY